MRAAGVASRPRGQGGGCQLGTRDCGLGRGAVWVTRVVASARWCFLFVEKGQTDPG